MEDSAPDIDRPGPSATAYLVQAARVPVQIIARYEEHAAIKTTCPRKSRRGTWQTRTGALLADKQLREFDYVEPGAVAGGTERRARDANRDVQIGIAQDRELGQASGYSQRYIRASVIVNKDDRVLCLSRVYNFITQKKLLTKGGFYIGDLVCSIEVHSITENFKLQTDQLINKFINISITNLN